MERHLGLLRGPAHPLIVQGRVIGFPALGQDLRLLDPVLPGNAVVLAGQATVALDIRRIPVRNLRITHNPLGVEQTLHLGIDGTDALQVVALRGGVLHRIVFRRLLAD